MTHETAELDVVSAEDEDSILAGLMTFIKREVEPIEDEVRPYFDDIRLYYDGDNGEAEEVSNARRRVRVAAAKAGYYNLFTTRALGGEGLGLRFFLRCTEAIHEKYGPGEPQEPLANEVLANPFMGPGPIWEHASAELRDELLPKLIAGRWRGSFGLTEPDAGSDVWNMQTTAAREGDDWIINGSKQWTSYVTDADFLFVFAVTDRAAVAERRGGITCFYVPTDTPGYSLDSTIKLFSDPGGKEGITSYTEVRVPDAWRMGPVTKGLDMAFLTLTTSRLWLAARCVGEGRWAFAKSAEYAKTRRTFGQPIAEHQSVQNLLAGMAVDLYTAHSAAMDCAARADAGLDVRAETSIVKYYGTNAGMRVFDSAIQIHGGMGIASETRLTAGWRFARTVRITEGTDQIMLRAIAAQTLRSGLQTW